MSWAASQHDRYDFAYLTGDPSEPHRAVSELGTDSGRRQLMCCQWVSAP